MVGVDIIAGNIILLLGYCLSYKKIHRNYSEDAANFTRRQNNGEISVFIVISLHLVTAVNE